jgi:hypothetical protein
MSTQVTVTPPVQTDDISVEQFCAELAKRFRVRGHEVALYALQRGMLRFLYPVELRFAGVIPLTSSAMAARTATTQRAEFFNSFASVRHSSVFETIKLTGAEGVEPSAMTIQKMITGPVLSPKGEVVGVLQISRKGMSIQSAGADFAFEDIRLLDEAGRAAGKLMPRFLEALQK